MVLSLLHKMIPFDLGQMYMIFDVYHGNVKNDGRAIDIS